MIIALQNLKDKVFCEEYDHDCSFHEDSNTGHFCEYCDHGRNPNKENCDHGRNLIETQKYSIFIRTKDSEIIYFYENRDHDKHSK